MTLSYQDLRTERLLLRRPGEHDVPLVFESFGADPEVMRYLAWRPHGSLADARAALTARLERLAQDVEYSWILELTATCRAVGMVSAWLEIDAAELGFALERAHWNQGLATEAVSAVTRWALGSAGLSRVWATCDVENRASVRVLEKAGLQNLGRFERGIVRPNLSPEPRPSLLFSSPSSTSGSR